MGVNLRRLSMKYAVYPYTLDNLYLSKVSENLLKSDISYIVPGGKVSEVSYFHLQSKSQEILE